MPRGRDAQGLGSVNTSRGVERDSFVSGSGLPSGDLRREMIEVGLNRGHPLKLNVQCALHLTADTF